MLAEAVEQMQSVDRLGHQFFQIGPPSGSALWEPPFDMFEESHQLCLIVALAGVVPGQLELRLERLT
jgi:HSP20 family molecular chaperone IbpA